MIVQILIKGWSNSNVHVGIPVNNYRPGVAEAVLQSPPSFIHLLVQSLSE